LTLYLNTNEFNLSNAEVKQFLTANIELGRHKYSQIIITIIIFIEKKFVVHSNNTVVKTAQLSIIKIYEKD